MSDHLLYDPSAEGFQSPLDIARSMAMTTTLGRVQLGTYNHPLEVHVKSTNESHDLWLLYARQLSIYTKAELPTVLPPQDRIAHPAYGDISKIVGEFTVQKLVQETAIRAEVYSFAFGYDFEEQIALSDFETHQVTSSIKRSWSELQSEDAKFNPHVVAQLAGTVALNTVLRQHMHEENILVKQLQLVS